MSDDSTQSRSLMPHFVFAAIVILLVAVAYVWLTAEEPPEPQPVTEPEPVVEIEEPEEEIPEPEILPEPEPVERVAEPTIEESLPDPEPIDVSDEAVKTSLVGLAQDETASALLVNEDLLQRFVVTAVNMANGEEVPNHQVFTPPSQTFRTYQQADKEWIDAASYKRYTPYVAAFDKMETETLLNLYQIYKPTIDDIFAEVGDPDDDFNYTLIEAIDHLLDTPEVPYPVEVYTDSVVYKFRDERLESLSGPQKHLLRMGPENMRQVKAKLREVKDSLQQ